MPFDSITTTKQVAQPRATAVSRGSDPTVDNRFIRALDDQMHFLTSPAIFDGATDAAVRAHLRRWQGGLYQ